jgi:hypothetical protein
MDLAALGRRLKIRKLELEKGAKPDGASANTRRLLVA